MSGKGGKGKSQLNGGKSALKTSSAKGKDDSSGKTKRGRKVQFDSDGDKVGKSGKGQTAKAPTPLELRVEQEISGNTKCLLDCEAAEILQGIQERMVVLSEDPTLKLPVSFDKGLMYARRHKLYENSKTVKQALQPLKERGVSDGEMCLIANFHLESVDEVFALVPSLKYGNTRKPKVMKLSSDADILGLITDIAENKELDINVEHLYDDQWDYEVEIDREQGDDTLMHDAVESEDDISGSVGEEFVEVEGVDVRDTITSSHGQGLDGLGKQKEKFAEVECNLSEQVLRSLCDSDLDE
nr:DNA-directed RNA polymerases IV and V subunit 4 [Ipomoea batatas]